MGEIHSSSPSLEDVSCVTFLRVGPKALTFVVRCSTCGAVV